MSATERRRGPAGDLSQWAVPAGIGLFAVAGCILWAGIHLGRLIDPGQPPLPDENPLLLPIYLIRGLVPVTTTDLVCTGVVGLLLLALTAAAGVAWWRRRRPGRHIDAAAQHMARGHELARFTKAEVARHASQLAVQTTTIGVFIGVTIAGALRLWAGWEDGEVNIWGPRTGKTSSRAVPVLLDAPGAALATTNRRDLVDLTRGARALAGAVFVFDPQQIIGETPAFTWDPLSYVLSGPMGSEVKAQQLAALFFAATTPPEASTDKFFDPKGKTLLGHLLHAGALGGKVMTDVYRWVNREKDDEPARILDARGFGASAEFVRGIIGSPDKQRGGIYATAELCITWMTNLAAQEWVTPQPGRPPFVPSTFASSTDTLYLVSREGFGTLAPLTTAMTAAVCEAAEYTASRSPGGRLPVPMVAVLDEVANVAPWPALPSLYSHYGGRGIYLLTILQSWKQGEDAFGPRGMAKLWSAATIRLYGGGDAEVPFLDDLRRLTGTYRPQQRSTTSSRGGWSTNYSEGTEDILDVADLASVPRGRAVLIPAGARPALIRTIPYYQGPWAGECDLSRQKYDPGYVPARPVLNPEPDVAPAGDGWAKR